MEHTSEDLLSQAMELQRSGQHEAVIALLDPQGADVDRDIRLTVQLAEARRRLGAAPEAAGLYREAALFYAGEGMLAHAVALERLVTSLAPDAGASLLAEVAVTYALAPAAADGSAPFADLFVTADAAALGALFDAGALRQLAAGEALASGADNEDALYVVLRGEVRLFARDPDGRWAEASRLRGGQVFATSSLRGEGIPGRAVAAFSSTVIRLPEAAVAAFAATDEGFEIQRGARLRRLALERMMVSHPAFGAITPPRARMRLSATMVEQRFNRGTVIFREGDPAEYLYLVMEGRVEVFTHGGDSRLELAQLGAGELFGELAALGGGPRTASVRARTDVVLYRIAGDALDEILDDQLEALDELKRVFRERVAETLERLRSDAT